MTERMDKRQRNDSDNKKKKITRKKKIFFHLLFHLCVLIFLSASLRHGSCVLHFIHVCFCCTSVELSFSYSVAKKVTSTTTIKGLCSNSPLTREYFSRRNSKSCLNSLMDKERSFNASSLISFSIYRKHRTTKERRKCCPTILCSSNI